MENHRQWNWYKLAYTDVEVRQCLKTLMSWEWILCNLTIQNRVGIKRILRYTRLLYKYCLIIKNSVRW